MKIFRQYFLINFFALVGFVVLLVLGFQNCSARHEITKSINLPLNHPPLESVDGLEARPPIGDRDYVESVFKDVFLSSDSALSEIQAVEYYLNSEFLYSAHLWGRPCDPYESGDLSLCGYVYANADLDMAARTSSGREASRLQLCRWMVTNDTLLNRAKAKVADNDPTPNADSVSKVVKLFYPALEETPLASAIAALLDLDRAMARANESVVDRWRILFLTVCETPGWVVL